MFRQLMLSTGFIAVSSAAMAAGAPMFSWTGFYVGAQGGYHWASVSHSNPALGPGIPIPADDFAATTKPGGFVGGFHAGYNYQINRFVIGVEGDFEVLTGKDTGKAQYAGLGGSFLHATSQDRWQGSLRARLGATFDNMMVYVTGGAAWRSVQYEYLANPAAPSIASYSTTLSGSTFGVGLERALNQNWLGQIEYRYAKFGTATGTLAPIMTGDARHVAQEADNSVRLAISYKFGMRP